MEVRALGAPVTRLSAGDGWGKAAYDSNGRIVSMISDAGAVDIASSIVAVLPTGKAVPLQVSREGSGAVRQGR